MRHASTYRAARRNKARKDKTLRLWHLEHRLPVLPRRRPGLIAEGWVTVAGNGTASWRRGYGAWHTGAHKSRAMGIDWMTQKELAQAIPYAEFIGRAAIDALNPRRGAA